MINGEQLYLVEQCARKVAPVGSPMGIGAGLGEHNSPMERPNKISIGDRSGHLCTQEVTLQIRSTADSGTCCFCCVKLYTDILTPYLDGIVSKLLLQNCKQMVQEGALTVLTSVVDSSHVSLHNINITTSLLSLAV
ncbi:DNA helicase [Tanacetum coccineum]